MGNDSETPNSKRKEARPRGRPNINKYESLWEILKTIEIDTNPADKLTLFRGHTSFRHKLRPSLFRTQNSAIKSNEHRVLSELIVRHPAEFSDDANTFEKLVRVQHYGLPTRLLDLTSNPLVAIFFAVEKLDADDAELISISIASDKVRYYDSDTVHLLANLAQLKPAE